MTHSVSFIVWWSHKELLSVETYKHKKQHKQKTCKISAYHNRYVPLKLFCLLVPSYNEVLLTSVCKTVERQKNRLLTDCWLISIYNYIYVVIYYFKWIQVYVEHFRFIYWRFCCFPCVWSLILECANVLWKGFA